MASNFRKFISFLSVILLSPSCETIVDVEIPVEQPKIVMNAIVNPDSTWSVNLTFSEHVLSNDAVKFVEQANVNIFDNSDQLVTTLHYDKRGFYRSESRPEPGKFYKIVAELAGYEPIEGSTIVPLAPKITNATARFSLFNYQPSGSYTVDFEDDPSTENYYEVFMETVVEIKDMNETRYDYFPLYIESDDPNVNTEILDFEVGVMLKDKLFSEKNIKLYLKTPEGGYGLGQWGTGTIVRVRSVTREYYDYATTLKLQFKISSDPLAQPVEVKSNIKNGLGLVAGVAQSNFYISRPVPVISNINPTSGKPGDVVLIEGENLYGDFSNTNVSFFTNTEGFFGTDGQGRVSAGIVAKTPNSLSVIVPTGAKTNYIILNAYGSFTISKEKFMILE